MVMTGAQKLRGHGILGSRSLPLLLREFFLVLPHPPVGDKLERQPGKPRKLQLQVLKTLPLPQPRQAPLLRTK